MELFDTYDRDENELLYFSYLIFFFLIVFYLTSEKLKRFVHFSILPGKTFCERIKVQMSGFIYDDAHCFLNRQTGAIVVFDNKITSIMPHHMYSKNSN